MGSSVKPPKLRLVIGMAGATAIFALAACATNTLPKPGHQPGGAYVLTAEEQQFACRQLKSRTDEILDEATRLPLKRSFYEEQLPFSISELYGRYTETPDQRLAAEYDRLRAELVAFSTAHADKGCGNLGVEAKFDKIRSDHPTLAPVQPPSTQKAAVQ